MTLFDVILAAALSLPAPWHPPGEEPETPEQYRARVAVIASAVALETPSLEWASVVLTVMHRESRFALAIHSGQKLGDQGRAICLSQQHRNGRSEAAWLALAGTSPEATRRCVRATYRTLRRAMGWCRSRHGSAGMAEALSLYANGQDCRASIGRARALRAQRLLDRMRRERSAVARVD